jgi:hypothetical protein
MQKKERGAENASYSNGQAFLFFSKVLPKRWAIRNRASWLETIDPYRDCSEAEMRDAQVSVVGAVSIGISIGLCRLLTVLAAKNRNEESRGPVLVSGRGVSDCRRRVRIGGQNRRLSTRGCGVFEHACDRR